MKKILLLVVIGLGLYGYQQHNPGYTLTQAYARQGTAIGQAYDRQQSHVQVSGSGTVIRVLRDDTKGRRHQKFILRLSTGKTVLIAHNIDLAPRIDALQKGDEVEFFGVYEWNSKGGLVHWTHRDPRGRHVPGWLKHNGVTYQ